MPIALVTGSGVRVGAATALALAEAGFDLILHGHHSVEALKKVADGVAAKGRKATCVVADLSKAEAIDALAAAVEAAGSSLDVLVNNAAIFEQTPFSDITRAAFARMQAVNLEAPFFLTQRMLPFLEKSGRGCVVNVADMACERPVKGYAAHYLVAKSGVAMLTRTLAVELGPRIRVNAVLPGVVASFPESMGETEKAEYLAQVPLKKVGAADDVAAAIVFLSTRASYVTGQLLAIDGGWSAHL